MPPLPDARAAQQGPPDLRARNAGATGLLAFPRHNERHTPPLVLHSAHCPYPTPKAEIRHPRQPAITDRYQMKKMRMNEKNSATDAQSLRQAETVYEHSKGTYAHKKHGLRKTKSSPVRPLRDPPPNPAQHLRPRISAKPKDSNYQTPASFSAASRLGGISTAASPDFRSRGASPGFR